jgi:uncharacterized damage-inducible protein DinB
MIRETLKQLFERDLRKTIEEIRLYKTDEDLWRLPAGISNSGGNLALHIVGNINHYFGANLGATGYRRERDREFSDTGLTRAEIVERLENTIRVLKDTIENLSDEDLQKDYPEDLGRGREKTLPVMVHLLTHLDYHLGQINYHRRFISE